MSQSLLLLATAHASMLASATFTTIDNTKPRLDSTGIILDGHDGRLQKFGDSGPYYLHTLAYGLCNEPQGQGCNQPDGRFSCGFRLDHNITVYTSDDLSSGSWEFVGTAMSATQRISDGINGTVFRPDLVYNKNTNLYVLWYNWVAANGTYMGYAAATSSTPVGPFTSKSASVPLSHNNATNHAGDYHIFVDDDVNNTAYVIYSTEHWMVIEQLTSDYLSSSNPSPLAGPGSPNQSWVPLGPYFVEAPQMFKRNDVYYALFDHCCCFCYQGSGIRVFTSTAGPLGPWTEQPALNHPAGNADLACVPPAASSLRGISAEAFQMDAGTGPRTRVAAAANGPFDYESAWRSSSGSAITPQPTPGQGCLYNNSNYVGTVRSQQSFIAEIDTPDGTEFIWAGDRWQQAPDGIKGHEPQFWAPLVFDDTQFPATILPVNWIDNFTIDVI